VDFGTSGQSSSPLVVEVEKDREESMNGTKKNRRDRTKDFQGVRSEKGKPRKDRLRSVMRRWKQR